MPDQLHGKVAIVTGAGRERGIGAAVAVRLARDGARLVISDIGRTSLEGRPEYPLGTSEELEQRAAEIWVLGAEVITILADVSRPEDVDTLAEELAPHGISVNTVCPGVIDTQLTDLATRVRSNLMQSDVDLIAFKARAAGQYRIPWGRMGMPEEGADLVAFLVSESSG